MNREKFFPAVQKNAPFPFCDICVAHAMAVNMYGGQESIPYPFGKEIAIQLSHIASFPVMTGSVPLLEAYTSAKKVFLEKTYASLKEEALEACRSHLLFALWAYDVLASSLSAQELQNAEAMLSFLKKMPDAFADDFTRRTSLSMDIVLQVIEEQKKGQALRAIYMSTDPNKTETYQKACQAIEKKMDYFRERFRDRYVGGEDIRKREQTEEDFCFIPTDLHAKACDYVAALMLKEEIKDDPAIQELQKYLRND